MVGEVSCGGGKHKRSFRHDGRNDDEGFMTVRTEYMHGMEQAFSHDLGYLMCQRILLRINGVNNFGNLVPHSIVFVPLFNYCPLFSFLLFSLTILLIPFDSS
jgi:hypothetical protein